MECMGEGGLSVWGVRTGRWRVFDEEERRHIDEGWRKAVGEESEEEEACKGS